MVRMVAITDSQGYRCHHNYADTGTVRVSLRRGCGASRAKDLAAGDRDRGGGYSCLPVVPHKAIMVLE
jgi:hypothetical protein